jgi:3-dehydroquinate dehydratase
MGSEGIPSRVRSLLYGAYLSYASIDGKNSSSATAPGQVPIEEFLDYLNKE